MIRVGLIGCGTVATYGHLPAIVSTSGLQLAAVCDIDANRAAATATRFGAGQAFSDLEAFFASGLDAVAITSPAPVHIDHVAAAARHRKPVLCEKPMAMNDAESERMIALMRQAKVPLYVGFTYRFSPAALQIHEMLHRGAIGKLFGMRLVYNWDCHGRYNRRDDATSGTQLRRHDRMLDGGPMVDCGVHQIDLARWWSGSEMRRITGHGAWDPTEGYDIPGHVYLHADHDNGVHTMVEISYTFGHTAKESRSDFVYEFTGSEGLIRFDRGAQLFECCTASGTQRLPFTSEKNFEGMYVAFEQALRTGEPGHLPTGADGLIATRIARQATEDAVARR